MFKRKLSVIRANRESPFGVKYAAKAFAVDRYDCLLFLVKDKGGDENYKNPTFVEVNMPDRYLYTWASK